jgi:tRNA nucleotidyltransferase (CCA-adding enzyme)
MSEAPPTDPVDIVVTHEFADFDALAATVAAQRLYPGSVIVLGRVVSPPVRSFLALHKDRFPHRRGPDVDQDAVRTLIVVDVRRASRLQAFERLVARALARDPKLKVVVWDHHGASEDDLPATEVHVENVGSATTLLVEAMDARDLTVDPVEATLFALGIHADTGSLRYPTSTARDAAALAWLMVRGASSSAVERYLDPPFSPAQQKALIDVLGTTRVQTVSGFRMGFCAIRGASRCPGLDLVTSQGRELLGLSALVIAYEVETKDRVDVVLRSATPYVDVSLLVADLGGGGHPSAASATARELSAEEAIARVDAALRRNPPAPRPVTDLMTTPVHVVPPTLPLATLDESLTLWRHTGAPVVEGGRLVGIVSRRDIEKARAAGALALPVGGRMTQKVHTIDVHASVDEAMRCMQTHDVGRLPVLHGDRLVGIVTRSDILGELYAPEERGSIEPRSATPPSLKADS